MREFQLASKTDDFAPGTNKVDLKHNGRRNGKVNLLCDVDCGNVSNFTTFAFGKLKLTRLKTGCEEGTCIILRPDSGCRTFVSARSQIHMKN